MRSCTPRMGLAKRMQAESGALRQVEDQIVGRVASGSDLLKDDMTFALELVGVEHGLGQDVGQDVERLRPVILEDAGVIGGGLHAGRGIDLAAGGFDLLGDGLGGAPFGALEGHVLEEMRDAVLLRQFVA